MGENPGELLKGVLSIASSKMDAGSPLVMDTDTREFLDGQDDFNIRKVFPFRVHKSLTRYIGLLRRN
jgi:tRNA G10  N-methylase Trm11